MKRAFDASGLEAYASATRQAMAEYRAERLAKYGWPEETRCPQCGDTGTPPDARGFCQRCELGRGLAAEAETEATWYRLVPARVADFRIHTSPDTEAAAIATAWLTRDPHLTGENLILTGPPGSGKTGLAYGVLYEIHHNPAIHGVFAVNVARWIDTMRPTTDPEELSEQATTLKRCHRTTVLLLDDLGTEKPSDWTRERVYDLVNHRYDAKKPTIITSNLNSKELRAVYGDRLVDRLTECCTGFAMKTGNYRQEATRGN